ncbi:DUF3097 domain-containing protein [Cryptosporangium aurantiacum]|uniref:DUF3097 domain-containing protein n=1 Tax=Cryptosporangium aurantiacum TaxID=134849 RepID=A0A1M7JCA5_9ACTN|nr:DUF3097 domain-containing protein [Cryptosporangium aurantiacum]SHM50636.1 Protein of unknown function [Cryptosporangium aurantiacum]
MRSKDYRDVLAGDWRKRRTIPTVEAEPDLVVEEAGSGFCGAVITCAKDAVTLEDRFGNRRVFPLAPAAFLIDGEPVTLIRPTTTSSSAPRRTASGSVAVDNVRARVAKASRIYVEGVHDAALVERVWGEDLRIEGVVVEPLHGVDDLPALIRAFGPGPERRLGVLVDHLVPGSKESRIVAEISSPHVLVTGHPFVDIWQAVKPSAVGIAAWPRVPKGRDWKQGVCDALGVADPQEMWRRVQAGVNSYADLETELLGAVERLIDHVTADVYGAEVR